MTSLLHGLHPTPHEYHLAVLALIALAVLTAFVTTIVGGGK